MYDQRREHYNVQENTCNFKLQSSNKIKMKTRFMRLTKVQKSPYHRGLAVWNTLPDKLQTEPSNPKFKREIKRYQFT